MCFGFPLHDFPPSLLIHRVMYRNDGVHIIFLGFPTFALHSIVKHLFGGVHPSVRTSIRLVSWREIFSGNGRLHSVLGERLGLSQARVPAMYFALEQASETSQAINAAMGPIYSLALSSSLHVVARIQKNHGMIASVLFRNWATCGRRRRFRLLLGSHHHRAA
jgi:hypothetical protein